jgi:pimeloyl-ACP methyl ester carboxylesterase
VAARPSVLDFAEEFRRMTVPVLLLTGDEDEQTLMPGVFMKKHIPTCGFCVLPRIGHTINLEEPGLFNLMLNDFLSAVELGKWQARDPRTMETAKYLAPREGEQ